MKKWVLAGSAAVVLAAQGFASQSEAKKSSVAVPQSMSAKDKATGAKAHPELLSEFGGLYEGQQAAYVTTIGRKVASQSGLANQPSEFTISLLNSPVNNAFAIPGGYVYITRQLMALMNSEAELASVLGHEVGHVAARHSQKRNSRATQAGIGAVLATVLGGVLLGGDGAKLGQQLGGAIAQRYVLSYSRAQEYEADDLGVTYLTKSGYDPVASSTMLASLAAQTSLDSRRGGRSENSLPEWASTHPDPASRVTRARQKALAAGAKGKASNRDNFLQMLDGVLYDDDPKQGVVEGSSFRHPELKLGFNAPSGYVMTNGAQAVSVSGTGGQAQFSGGAFDGNLETYIGNVFKAVGGSQSQMDYGSVRRTTINGLDAGYASARATTRSGQVDVTVYAYVFGPSTAYHIVAINPVGSRTFDAMFQSVRRLSTAEAGAIKPRRIDVITVKSGDSVKSLADRMAYPDYRMERFQVLNGLGANDVLKPGQKVKIAVQGT